LSPELFVDPNNAPIGSYHLCGVVNHIGDSPRSGHYTACVKDAEGWIFYDDAVGVRRSFNFVQETSQSRCYLALYEWKEN
jgi:ubiquitin C-terminal hydrolase